MDPRIVEAYDAISGEYDGWFSEKLTQAENDAIRLLLGDEPEVPVLDVGCGSGLFLDLYPEIPPSQYLGVDVSPRMLERARDRFPWHEFAKIDMCDLSEVSDNWFGTVVSLFSFAYAANPMFAASELVRVTKPGGRVFIVTYAPRHRYSSKYPVEWNPPRIDWTGTCLQSCFNGALEDVRTGPFNVAAHTVSKVLPRKALARYITWEHRVLPDTLAWYTCYSGTKKGS